MAIMSGRVCLAEALTTRAASNPLTCNLSGFLLWLFSAVLCPTLSWPMGDSLVHKLTRARLRGSLASPGRAGTPGERQSNPIVFSCPTECVSTLWSDLSI